MKFFQIFALIAFALLAGCQKDPTTGTTEVSGQIVESLSKQPVGGGTVQVYHSSTGGGYVPVGSPYPADAQGRFSFHFEADSKTGYVLLAQAPPGYFTPFYAAPDLTAGRQNQNLVVPMLAPAWVKLQLVDVPPKSRVYIHASGYEGPGDQLYYPRDTTLVRPVLAGFSGKIIWVITNEQGIDTQYSQAVQVGALDTVKVYIPF